MRFGGIVLATAFVLGACSSDPAPREPSDPAPSTSAAPTITVPTPVAQVSEDTPEGAAAFVKHYVDVFNYAAATGDVDELSRLSSPDCGGCQKYVVEFKNVYDRGDRIETKLWSLSDGADLRIQGNRVTAVVAVNEGEMKQYTFNFYLPEQHPYSVEDILIEGKS